MRFPIFDTDWTPLSPIIKILEIITGRIFGRPPKSTVVGGQIQWGPGIKGRMLSYVVRGTSHRDLNISKIFAPFPQYYLSRAALLRRMMPRTTLLLPFVLIYLIFGKFVRMHILVTVHGLNYTRRLHILVITLILYYFLNAQKIGAPRLRIEVLINGCNPDFPGANPVI